LIVVVGDAVDFVLVLHPRVAEAALAELVLFPAARTRLPALALLFALLAEVERAGLIADDRRFGVGPRHRAAARGGGGRQERRLVDECGIAIRLADVDRGFVVGDAADDRSIAIT